jgi:serine/threonine protein kinase
LDGRYRLEHPIGRGGFGTVWLATDLRSDEAIAVKLPRTEFLPHPPGPTAGREEYAMLDRLCHPSIVPVYGHGVHEGKVFIVSKLMTGGTLADTIRRGPIRPKDALLIIRDIAEAVLFIHHYGIIHRDLKPHNVLLDADGRAFLTDFGLALRSPPGTFATPQKTGGTAGYSAPEQFEAGARIDHRCDQYALGVLLFELLTGRRPLAAPDESEVTTERCWGGVWGWISRERAVPRRLRPLIRRCLAETPADRLISVWQFIDAVDAELDRRGIRRRGGSNARNSRRAWPPCRQRFLMTLRRWLRVVAPPFRRPLFSCVTVGAAATAVVVPAVPFVGLHDPRMVGLILTGACFGVGILFAGRLRVAQIAILIVAVTAGIWLSRKSLTLWDEVSTVLNRALGQGKLVS